MKVRVDGELCAGHGRCYELAPEVYGEDERGHCRVLHPEIAAALAAKARLGERNCPEGAIFIDEE